MSTAIDRCHARRRSVLVSVAPRSTLILLLGLFYLAPANAQNLLTNSTFDTDVSGWIRSAYDREWSPDDANGSPTSGSIKGLHPNELSGGAFTYHGCLPVTGGAIYDVAADLRLPPFEGFGNISVSVRSFSSNGCLNQIGLEGVLSLTNSETTGGWVHLDQAYTPLTGAASILFEIGLNAPGTAEGYADNVEFCLEGTCDGGTGIPTDCTANATTACLLDERFEVTVEWTDFESNTGVGRVMEFNSARAENDQSAFFWFFNPENFEMGVKMVDACVPPFNNFWVFTSGLTNVGYLVRVVDTANGSMRVYTNPIGLLPTTKGDTLAFPCDGS